MDGSLIGNRERSEEAGGSRGEADAAKVFIFQEDSALMGLLHVDLELPDWDAIHAGSQHKLMCRIDFFISLFFFYNHLEIGDKTKLQQVDLEVNRCLAERMTLSLFGEQILHFTCDINRCLFELLHHPIR